MTRTVRALLCAGALSLASPAGAGAAALATGTLTDASGEPSAGQIRVYAWPEPKLGQTVEMPLLGTGTAGPDGRFTVTTLDTGRLAQIAARRDGWVDFKIVGDTGAFTGHWGYTARVDAQAGQARVSDAQAALDARDGQASASAGVQTPYVRVHATRPALARAAQGGCDTKMRTRPVRSIRKLTVVGELNNAYNDGTVGRFTYARSKSAETWMGLAAGVVTPKGEINWGISEEYLVSNKGKVTFPPATKRYSRKLRSLFEFTKYETQASSCAVWEPMIKATSWIGDDDSTVKQDGLDKCDPKHLHGHQGAEGEWLREDGDAVRFTKAVEAFGVNITARSGFSRDITLEYKWGGPERKRHYLCGPDGKQSAMEAGRVFSGARK